MPTPKGGRQNRGACLSPKGAREVQWQLDIRAWTFKDYAEAAGVHWRTVQNYINGERVEAVTLAQLQRALIDNPPIPGLAEILSREVGAAS